MRTCLLKKHAEKVNLAHLSDRNSDCLIKSRLVQALPPDRWQELCFTVAIKTQVQQQEGDINMSIAGRIDELSSKHRTLDQRIAEELKHPASDELVIKDLKRKKLRIKEELQMLKAS